MATWTFVRFLHIAAIAVFVGGQLVLASAVTPAARRHGATDVMRDVARRFGVVSAIALAVAIATGALMASHLRLWGSTVLHVKLAVLALVFVLTGVHVVAPRARVLSYAIAAASVLIVWLGVKLTYG